MRPETYLTIVVAMLSGTVAGMVMIERQRSVTAVILGVVGTALVVYLVGFFLLLA